MRTLSLCLLLAGAASAQDAVTLTPGHPDLDLRAITLADATIDVRMVRPEAQVLGSSTESASLDGDVLTLITRSSIPMAGEPRTDSTLLAWPSLAPLSDYVITTSISASAVFTDGHVAGSYTAGSGPLPFEFDLSRPVFTMTAMPLIVRALPLDRTGYQATVPVFTPDNRFKEATLTIVGPHTATLSDGTEVEAIAVDQVGGGGITQGFSQRHLIDPATRELLYTELEPPGMFVRLEPISPEALAAREADGDAAAAAASQNKLMPGSPDLIAPPPQTADYTVFLVQPMQQEFGSIKTIEILEGDRLTYISNVQIPQAGQDQQDTTVVAYPSLAPISRVEITPSEVERGTYENGRFIGTKTSGGETATIEAELGDAFGAGSTRLLIRSLPFAEGYTASFDQLDGDGEISTSRLLVTGQQAYTKSDGTETTVWVVTEEEADAPDYEYYVDAETREMLMMAFSPQAGVRVEIVAQ